ncbi:MAG: aminoacyl-histidine dipeptidase [Cryomorphaceae bacterium BACL7 MAG-120910-bin2]|jgi:dipeptidase D|nr:MAG: aminoacyl-histidine dipeptidase [Cryomorphaceae bacterium BACL7 MAG-120910-bin2]|tara:strand:+ start:533 stop:2008 length:1476 start_codon:yes stop_codon:yes gene_type:complete
MSTPLAHLKPKAVWSAFEELNAVPRPSKREEKIQAFAQEIGTSLGLPTDTDEVGNVRILKSASPGMEAAPTVVIQAHLDMVCQKNEGTEHDFDHDGINMFIDNGWVKAHGTTLGADNGMGVAIAIATLRSTEMVHPALEVLFTSDEETGMTGALGLKEGWITGKYLLNIDTEDDNELTIGCAGGIDVTAAMPTSYRPAPVPNPLAYKILIKGLTGGHSGMDIHLGRGNANLLMGRLLRQLESSACVLIHSMEGGNLRNAIPRECKATVVMGEAHATQLENEFSAYVVQLKKEFSSTDPNLEITLQKIGAHDGLVLAAEQQAQLLAVVAGCPAGILRMNPEVNGLVQTSNNLAKIHISEVGAEILCLTRSSSESEKMDAAQRIASILGLAGFTTTFAGSYPGWEPSPGGTLASLMRNTYLDLFEDEPQINACHAGLECGIIGERCPGMEMISFGPNIRGAHSPDERVEIASVQKSWDYYVEVLKRLAQLNQS